MAFPTVLVPTYPEFEGLSALDVKRATAFAEARRASTTPRNGDIIQRTDGRVQRVSHIWAPDEIQPGNGSFYACVDREGTTTGGASMSGGLDPSIALEVTPDTKAAAFWFFKDAYSTAHNGVTFMVPVRVWKEATHA